MSSKSNSQISTLQYDAKIGEFFKENRYEILKWLGDGTFSKVWLVYDHQEKQNYALKIQQAIYADEATDEIKILKKVDQLKSSQQWEKLSKQLGCNSNNCVRMVDNFLHEVQSENQDDQPVILQFYCMVMEVLGPTLLDLIYHYENKGAKMSIELAKYITKQILIGLIYIHNICEIIHTDLKPENIMIGLTEEQLQDLISNQETIKKQNVLPWEEIPIQKKVKQNDEIDQLLWQEHIKINISTNLQFKIVDFGNACEIQEQYEEIQTKEYKSPESIIQARYYANTDIWSLACIIFEMITNNYLFKPQGNSEQEETDDLLAMMIEVLGYPENEFILSGQRSQKYFTNQGKLKSFDEFNFEQLSTILIEQYEFNKEDAIAIQEMLTYCLVWDPKKRPQSIDVFKHKWLNN